MTQKLTQTVSLVLASTKTSPNKKAWSSKNMNHPSKANPKMIPLELLISWSQNQNLYLNPYHIPHSYQSVKRIHLLHLLNHLRIIIIIPLRQVNPLLHLLQSLLQHLRKLRRHILNLLLQLIYLHLLNLQSLFLLLPCLHYHLVIPL